MNRKEFLKVSGIGAGSVFAGASILSFISSCNKGGMMNGGMNMQGQAVQVAEGNFNRLLPIPNEVPGFTTLTAQPTTADIKGVSSSVLGYQPNAILGPTIRVNEGASVNINFRNKLSEKSNIHWHGLKIPAEMDGHPESTIEANGSFNYQFTINQRAGLNWYHPHPDGATARQAFLGLAGLFIVNNSEEALLNLPSGNAEIPLVIQDKRFTGSGIDYNPSMMDVMTGYMGETVIVNGVASPFTEVATAYYRLRILNGSNARIYNLAFSNNADLLIIGNDGGLLKSPAAVKSILISPGERLDVLVNFSGLTEGSDVYLESRQFSNAGSVQGKQKFKILRFKIKNIVNDRFSVPTTLASVNSISTSAVTTTRNFVINEMQMSGSGMTGLHKINGKTYDKNRIDETVSANTTELWVFDNTNGQEPHPIHLHAVHFQLLERTGGRGQLTAAESGWKDTVLVLPGEKVKMIVPFAGNAGKFVLHCHNLEHEDDGMMLQYQIS